MEARLLRMREYMRRRREINFIRALEWMQKNNKTYGQYKTKHLIREKIHKTEEEMKRSRKKYENTYRDKHPEKYEKKKCECGGSFSERYKALHFKTKKHLRK